MPPSLPGVLLLLLLLLLGASGVVLEESELLLQQTVACCHCSCTGAAEGPGIARLRKHTCAHRQQEQLVIEHNRQKQQ